MATRLTTIGTIGLTIPSAIGDYTSMRTTGLTTTPLFGSSLFTMPDGDKRLPTSFYSERIDAEVTIAGTVTFNVWWACPATFTAKARTKLSKVTGAGGGNIETLICQQDSATLTPDNVQTKYTVTVTPSVPVTVAVGERLIMRLYLTPIDGSFGTGDPTVAYGDDVDATGNTWAELTETVVFRSDITALILRRTSANGIGNFFDMLEARGSSAATTGVVNTTAGGTQIQWTRTAGGTVLEWVSQRMHHPGWNCAATANIQLCSFWSYESNVAANCTIRFQIFRRDAQGAETLIVTKSKTDIEFGIDTSGVFHFVYFPGGLDDVIPAVFEEDDRLGLRVYIINVGTMAGGHTCTLKYDHNVALAVGDSLISFAEVPRFKAESDPPKSYRVVGGMTMGGVGN